VYIFGALGRNYADAEKFKSKNINIYFQEYVHPVYTQIYKPFVVNLSVVDLLFNCGPRSGEILMKGNLDKAQLLFKAVNNINLN